jgi:extracellular elastinolytic metalloproteinase
VARAGRDAAAGDNAYAFKDVRDEVGTVLTEDTFEDSFDPPDDGDVPPSNGVDWLYPITSVPDAAGFCPADAPGCTWNHTTPFSWQVNDEQATTQLFYFVNKFHDHLLAPPIGFDEASGNFEQVNQSGQGAGGDPVWAQSDDGADTDAGLPDADHQDNANFDTRPDGVHPGRMQMYLWEPLDLGGGFVLPFATVNGSDDPTIVYHEYTHGLSNRLIVDAQGFGGLAGAQSGAMGEAWSDWYALDFLARDGLITDGAQVGDVKVGAYVDNGSNLIRSQPADCPPDEGSADCPGFAETGPGGYTYADFGLIAIGEPGGVKLPEVHADGEIWGQTLWQLRQRLVARYGQAGGSDRAERYVTGGMRLGPPSPSFLDQRNAILQASTVAGGADSDLIWDVFASRGMGYFASTRGDFDANPDADFSTPPTGSPTGIVRGIVRDDGGAPVAGALVGLGGHDGPPGAGPALQDTTDGTGAYEITGIPQASYPQLTVEAPAGYADAFGGAVTVGSTALSKDLTVRRNYADSRTGATITSDARDEREGGCGRPNLIDGDEATVLETASPDDPETEEVESTPRSFTVRLPQPVDGAEVFIDPSSGCNSIADSSLAVYTVQVSTDGTSFTTVGEGTFDRHSLYRLNRVPAKGMPNGVRAVRLIAHATQGMIGGPIGDLGVLDIAELQVYARPNGPSAPGTPGTPGAPGTAQLRPDLSRAKRRVRVSRKRVSFRVRCVRATPGVAPKTCRLRLSIAGVVSGKPIAKRTFSLRPGAFRTVRLSISARNRRRLRRHSVKTRLRAQVANVGGRTRRTSRPLRILRTRRG